MKTLTNSRSFCTKNVLATLLLTLLASGMTWSAHAAKIISFQMAGTSTTGNMVQGPSLPGDQAGAPGVRTTNWNSINVTTATAAVTLGAGSVHDNKGNIIPAMTATLVPNTFGPGAGASGTVSNEAKLYGYQLDTQPGNTENYLNLTGIPYTNYMIFCYRSSAEGSVALPRGGYFSIRDVATNYTYITNLDSSVTSLTNMVTNFQSTVWAQSPNFANPTATGNGYVQSFTTNQPSNMSQINPGNFMVLPGDPHPIVSYVTNINLATSTTNVTSTTNNSIWIYFTPVGGGLHGVAGGDTTQRFKCNGIQIVGFPTANLTNIVLNTPIPNLLEGNPVATAISAIGQYDDGDTFPLPLLPGVVYTSQNTNFFSVNSSGLISPAHPGTSNLIITSGSISFTQAVTVLPAIAARLSLTPTTLFLGNNGIADKVQATLFADFAGASTNAAVSNINVTAYNYVAFSGTPTSIISVSPSGLVTPIGTNANNIFSLQAIFDTISASLNGVGTVQPFPTPGTVASFAVDIWDGATVDAANFKDFTGAPGVRQAYWNSLNCTVPSSTAWSNAVVNPIDYHGNPLAGTVAVITGGSIGYSGTIVTTALGTNEYKIMHMAYDEGANGGVATTTMERSIVVTNVPYDIYDAYFYIWNDTGNTTRAGHVTAYERGETRWRVNVATLPGSLDNIAPNPGSTTGAGYKEAIPTITGGSIPNNVLYSDVSLVPGGNYIHFTGLTNKIAVFGWGPDNVSTVPNANGTMRMRLCGFQIARNLSLLTPTNIYLDSSSNLISTVLPGNPAVSQIYAFADFTDGTKDGNISAYATYLSSNTNIFNVTSNGMVSGGTTSGTANLIVSYKGVSYTQTVTALAPVSVRVQAVPDTAYIDGANLPGTLHLFATFPGQTNVDVSSFGTVSWNSLTPSVANVSDTGNPPASFPVTIQGVALGSADLSANYMGISYTNLAGFNVRSVSDPISLTNQTNLKHRYSFRDAPGSTVIVDSVGGANGVIKPGLSGSFPLVLDGNKVNFPANNVFSTTPYIALPSGIISQRADVTIDMWCGMNQATAQARFFDFGTSGKGADEHNNGNGITWLEFTGKGAVDAVNNPNGNAVFQYLLLPGGTSQVIPTASAFPVGTEQHVTCVYSFNQGVIKLYINGVLQSTAIAPFPLASVNDINNWLGVSQFQDPVLNGWIDELRIYEGAFADSDVAASDAAGPDIGLPPAVSTTQTPITSLVSGNALTLSWPSDHTGWRLQVQTNALNSGLGTNWVDWAGANTTNQVTIPIVNGNPTVFFRLVYP